MAGGFGSGKHRAIPSPEAWFGRARVKQSIELAGDDLLRLGRRDAGGPQRRDRNGAAGVECLAGPPGTNSAGVPIAATSRSTRIN